jgi:hypothetical protein
MIRSGLLQKCLPRGIAMASPVATLLSMAGVRNAAKLPNQTVPRDGGEDSGEEELLTSFVNATSDVT